MRIRYLVIPLKKKEENMNRKKIKQAIFYLGAIGLSIFLLFFFITGVWIGYEVKNSCKQAQAAYEGDCVEALSALLIDENQSFWARNNAIWALGQFRDSRAVSVLEKYYTGDIPDREPINETISQYELEKSLNLSRGGTNLGAFIWRKIFN